MATEETKVDKVRFNFRRSNYFRVIHCDLAWGGLTPGNNLAVTIFSDSPDHPSSIVHALSADGDAALGAEIGREGDPQDEIVIAREAEAKIILTPNAARRMVNALQQMLREFEFSDEDEGTGT